MSIFNRLTKSQQDFVLLVAHLIGCGEYFLAERNIRRYPGWVDIAPAVPVEVFEGRFRKDCLDFRFGDHPIGSDFFSNQRDRVQSFYWMMVTCGLFSAEKISSLVVGWVKKYLSTKEEDPIQLFWILPAFPISKKDWDQPDIRRWMNRTILGTAYPTVLISGTAFRILSLTTLKQESVERIVEAGFRAVNYELFIEADMFYLFKMVEYCKEKGLRFWEEMARKNLVLMVRSRFFDTAAALMVALDLDKAIILDDSLARRILLEAVCGEETSLDPFGIELSDLTPEEVKKISE